MAKENGKTTTTGKPRKRTSTKKPPSRKSQEEVSTPADAKTIELEGKLGVQTAGEIRSLLLQVMDQTDNVVVSVGRESEMDVAFLQVLCSAHMTALGRGKTVILECQCVERLKELLDDSGFARHSRCVHESRGECLWSREGN